MYKLIKSKDCVKFEIEIESAHKKGYALASQVQYSDSQGFFVLMEKVEYKDKELVTEPVLKENPEPKKKKKFGF